MDGSIRYVYLYPFSHLYCMASALSICRTSPFKARQPRSALNAIVGVAKARAVAPDAFNVANNGHTCTRAGIKSLCWSTSLLDLLVALSFLLAISQNHHPPAQHEDPPASSPFGPFSPSLDQPRWLPLCGLRDGLSRILVRVSDSTRPSPDVGVAPALVVRNQRPAERPQEHLARFARVLHRLLSGPVRTRQLLPAELKSGTGPSHFQRRPVSRASGGFVGDKVG